MFCTKCGAACADGTKFCMSCGNPLQAEAPVQQPVYQAPVEQPAAQPVYQAPVEQPGAQPVYQQPVYQAPVQPAPQKVREPVVYKPFTLNAAGAVKKFNRFVALGVAVLALVMFVLSTFCILDLPMTAKVSGDTVEDAYEMVEDQMDVSVDPNSVTLYLSAGEVGDLVEMAEDNNLFEMAEEYLDLDISISAVPLYIGNILYGIINLVIAGVCVLYFLKKQNNMPFYDDFVGRYIKLENPVFLACAAGIVGAVLQAVLFLLAGMSESYQGIDATLTFGAPAMTWIAVAIYAVVGVADLLAQGKED